MALPLIGQEKGSIEGRLSDSETGEPLPGVNVMVKGTYYGAASDADGYFRITNVSTGSYDMEVSMIGYKVILRTGVKVNAGRTTTVDFQLEQTVLALGEEVVVVGKKPLFDVDETASITKLSSDDLEDMIVNSVEDILAAQVGVTKVNNEIHIRGGRIDESLYIIDGLSIKDPLSGYSGNLFVNAESIENLEIITGGYNAEYGQAMSGIINIRLKEGRDKFEGSIKYLSDHWGAATGAFEHFNSDRFEMNLGGPSPLLELMAPRLGLDLPGKFSFFANAYGKINDSHLPTAKQLYPHRNWIPPSGLSTQKSDEFLGRLAPRENNDWHALY
ncbi:MAG: carboxypeptidase regulatory-like domain-containing protein, partial [Candidatus Marinimicrobia bacterium]|nr:carboxypeptidase regulatory-like domain-containing protein [Candidatus Neomarinimicrobiota bacterium]